MYVNEFGDTFKIFKRSMGGLESICKLKSKNELPTGIC